MRVNGSCSRGIYIRWTLRLLPQCSVHHDEVSIFFSVLAQADSFTKGRSHFGSRSAVLFFTLFCLGMACSSLPPLDFDSECILLKLHGYCSRRLIARLGSPTNGLGDAARKCRRKKIIPNGLAAKLVQLDYACAWNRHASLEKAASFRVLLDVQLGSGFSAQVGQVESNAAAESDAIEEYDAIGESDALEDHGGCADVDDGSAETNVVEAAPEGVEEEEEQEEEEEEEEKEEKGRADGRRCGGGR